MSADEALVEQSDLEKLINEKCRAKGFASSDMLWLERQVEYEKHLCLSHEPNAYRA